MSEYVCIEKAANFIIKELVDIRLGHCCLIGSTLLYEHLINIGLSPKLKLGFCNICNKFSTVHVWVEMNSVVYDIGNSVISELSPIVKGFKKSLSDKPKYPRTDLDTEEEKWEYGRFLNGFKTISERKFEHYYEALKEGEIKVYKKINIIRNKLRQYYS